MQLHEVLEIIDSKPKGSFITLIYTRPIKIKKAAIPYNYGTKTTRCTIRTGISYTNTKVYKNKQIEEYVRINNQFPSSEQLQQFINNNTHSLQWGQWYIPNTIIQHKKDDVTNYYLRCYSSINPNATTYILNGEAITKEELKKTNICLASEFSRNTDGCFVLNIENIKKIY